MRLFPDLPPDRPVLIAGPTASGKSGLALDIADQGGGIIVNADALQVFDCWRLLTARPDHTDTARHPHKLYGHVSRDSAYSVGHWLRDVSSLKGLGQRLIIVGGTGLYLTALTTGLAPIPPIPAAIRTMADERRRAGDLTGMLADLDADTRSQIDTRNPARVQRAWEVLNATGRGLADWQDQTGPALLPLENAEAIVLRPDVAWLNGRIDQRFDSMVAMGAVDEVAAELPFWDPDHASARAIGAPELIRHLRGEMALAPAIAAAKQASRQYAKRQRTWLRSRMKAWHEVFLP